MDMVGHQHGRVHMAANAQRNFVQVCQVAQPISVCEERRLPVVALLYDVLRNTRKIDSRLTGQGRVHVEWTDSITRPATS